MIREGSTVRVVTGPQRGLVGKVVMIGENRRKVAVQPDNGAQVVFPDMSDVLVVPRTGGA